MISALPFSFSVRHGNVRFAGADFDRSDKMLAIINCTAHQESQKWDLLRQQKRFANFFSIKN